MTAVIRRWAARPVGGPRRPVWAGSRTTVHSAAARDGPGGRPVRGPRHRTRRCLRFGRRRGRLRRFRWVGDGTRRAGSVRWRGLRRRGRSVAVRYARGLGHRAGRARRGMRVRGQQRRTGSWRGTRGRRRAAPGGQQRRCRPGRRLRGVVRHRVCQCGADVVQQPGRQLGDLGGVAGHPQGHAERVGLPGVTRRIHPAGAQERRVRASTHRLGEDPGELIGDRDHIDRATPDPDDVGGIDVRCGSARGHRQNGHGTLPILLVQVGDQPRHVVRIEKRFGLREWKIHGGTSLILVVPPL